MKRFVMRKREGDFSLVCQAFALHPTAAGVLAARGVRGYDDVRRFLDPRVSDLYDPALLPDGLIAFGRIEKAVRSGERVAVFGDDDCDGIAATAVLVEALRFVGGSARPWVPDRLREGYGIHPDAVDALADEGCKLIITVDGSVSAHDGAKRAAERGVDLIITDHHEPGESLPRALAVVDPKRRDSWYAERNLAGAGVAFKVAQGVFARFGVDDQRLVALADLAALGTVVDRVPVVGENRTIAALGFPALDGGKRPGVALMRAQGYHICGRGRTPTGLFRALRSVEGDSPGLRLLLAYTSEEAESVFPQVMAHEAKHRESLESAIANVAVPDEVDGNVVIVVLEGEDMPLGGVATHLNRATGYPAAAVLVSGRDARVELRGDEAADFPRMLREQAELYDSFGGHKGAAGALLQASKLDEWKGRVKEYAEARWSSLRPQPVAVDCELPLGEVDEDLALGLLKLRPFGVGFPRPLFASPDRLLPYSTDPAWMTGVGISDKVRVETDPSFEPSGEPSRIVYRVEFDGGPIIVLQASASSIEEMR